MNVHAVDASVRDYQLANALSLSCQSFHPLDARLFCIAVKDKSGILRFLDNHSFFFFEKNCYILVRNINTNSNTNSVQSEERLIHPIVIYQYSVADNL